MVPFFNGGHYDICERQTILRRNFLTATIAERRFAMRKLLDWLIGGNLDRLLKAIGGED